MRFLYGVVEPEFSEEQVKKLHLRAGPSFQKVVREINELSGTTEKAAQEADAAFPGAE